MLEVLAYIALVYFIGAVLTFGVLTFVHGVKDLLSFESFIAAALAFFWPVTVPVMLHILWEDRHKRKKQNGRKRNSRN